MLFASRVRLVGLISALSPGMDVGTNLKQPSIVCDSVIKQLLSRRVIKHNIYYDQASQIEKFQLAEESQPSMFLEIENSV